MPHEIETMMYNGAVPWHGLGKYVGDRAVDSKTAIVESGLDWTVEKHPVRVEIRRGRKVFTAESDEFFSVVRNTDLKILGVVEGRYKPFQNVECFGFMDNVAGPTGDVRYHTAGSLRGGKQVWMLAKLESMVVEPVRGDVSDCFLLLSNSHDGSSSLRCFFTTVRVVCANTMAIALREGKGDGITIRHTGSIQEKVKEAQRVLGLAVGEFDTYRKMAKYLAGLKVNKDYFDDFVDHLFPIPEDKDPTRMENIREKIADLFESGRGTKIKGVAGTRWGLLNAVTEWTNHHKNYKKTNYSSDDNRLQSLWFGQSQQLHKRAVDKLLIDA